MMLGSRAVWRKQIRGDALAATNSRCTICGLAEERLLCHEKWDYDEERAIATLVGFEMHCQKCDSVTHAGNAAIYGNPKEVVPKILLQLQIVNRCSNDVALQVLKRALEQWEERNKKNWTIKVAAPLLGKYPELEALASFVPSPRRIEERMNRRPLIQPNYTPSLRKGAKEQEASEFEVGLMRYLQFLCHHFDASSATLELFKGDDQTHEIKLIANEDDKFNCEWIRFSAPPLSATPKKNWSGRKPPRKSEKPKASHKR